MPVLPKSPLNSSDWIPAQLLSCEDALCENGNCVLLNQEPVCECLLGYTGKACDETINEAVAVPLTLGVLAFIIGGIILIFIIALFRRKRKVKKRLAQEEEQKNFLHFKHSFQGTQSYCSS